jgi:hypothetical protein
MQTHTGSTPHWLVLPLVVLALTACTRQATQAPLDAPMNVSGSWNETAARVTAEALVKEALKQPWPRRFTQIMGRAPVVSVGTVVNRTDEQLNTQTFVQALERGLADSGQVQLAAAAGQRQETRQESGADFVLQGVITTLRDTRDGMPVAFYQVALELVDLASNVPVWQEQRQIKK